MTDDELLDQLSMAFAPTRREPPADALRALHDAIDVIVQPLTARRTVRPRWAIPALAGILVLSGSGVAFAASPTINRAARQFAHAIGLPVDSPRLDDAQHHREQLGAALRAGDRRKIAAAAAALREDVQHLDSEERDQIQPDADELLRQADQSLAAQPAEATDGTGTQEGRTSTPDEPTTAPHGTPSTVAPQDTPSPTEPQDTPSTIPSQETSSTVE